MAKFLDIGSWFIFREDKGDSDYSLSGLEARFDGDQYQLASALSRHVLEKFPGLGEDNSTQGLNITKLQSHKDVLESYKQVMLRESGIVAALNALASLLHDQSALEEAKYCYEQIIGLNPEHAIAHHN